MRGTALLALLAAALGAAPFPGQVEGLRPQLAQAELRLQDASLAHEAARREAQPEAEAVAAARSASDHWWGRWRLRRALARLKARLDRVEAARVEQEAARQDLFAILTALEEELRSALEKRLAAPPRPAEGPELRAWWAQLQAWSTRLEGLEGHAAPAPSEERKARSQVLAQARVEQLERDLALLGRLKQLGILGPDAQRADARRLNGSLARWRASAR